MRRERWTPGRLLAAGTALPASTSPTWPTATSRASSRSLRPDDLFDRQLADLDRGLFAGNDPAALLHTLLGTGLADARALDRYVAFIVFLPLTIGVALVFARDLEAGLFYTTAQSINWILGAASYFVLPALGPIYARRPRSPTCPPPRSRACRACCWTSASTSSRTRRPRHRRHRRLRLAAHLDELHGRVAAHLLGFGRRVTITLWVGSR